MEKEKNSSLNNKTKEEMDFNIDTFTSTTFGNDFMSSLGQETKETFRYKMVSMLYSHRHEKDDRFLKEIKEAGYTLNFDILRDVMYKYSKKA